MKLPTPIAGRLRHACPGMLPYAGMLLVAALMVTTVPADAASRGVEPDVALATFDQVWDRVRDSHYDYPRLAEAWKQARAEIRPRAAEVRDAAELRGVLGKLLERIGDSHFQIIPGAVLEDARGEAVAADAAGVSGLAARLIEGALVIVAVEPDSPAARAGLRAGARVVVIDDEPVAPSLERLWDLQPGPAKARARMFLEAHMHDRLAHHRIGRELVLEVVEHGAAHSRRVALQPARSTARTLQLGNLPAMRFEFEFQRHQGGAGCIGRIRFSTWVPALSGKLTEAMAGLRDCAGLVFDLRGNPGGMAGMVMPVAAYLYDQPATLGTMTSVDDELHFRALPKRVEMDGTRVEPYAGPVAVLIDGQSASTTEIFAAGLQATGRARVFGDRSAGMALPALTEPLASGDILMYAFADFTGPNGRRIEGAGVEPDQPVALDPAVLAEGIDPVFAAAADWIDNQTNPTRRLHDE